MRNPWIESRIAAFCERYGGKRIRALAESVPLSIPCLQQVRESVPQLLAAQQIILRHLLRTRSAAEVLDMFGIPRELLPWMSILDDPTIDPPMLRVDVLPTVDDRVWICELNIDSSVGGAEAAQFWRIEELKRGLLPKITPYEHLVILLGRILADIRGSKVCLLDWSHWEEYGAFGLEWLEQTLTVGLPGVEVYRATEKDDLSRVDCETVVFRVFLSQDALTHPELVSKTFARAGYVLSDFSGDLLGSKVWMALFHDAFYRQMLDASMLDAIDSTVPMTLLVDETNFLELLARKDDLFFKAASDFGGYGVIAGRVATKGEIRERLGDPSAKKWIAQKACALAPLPVRPLDAGEPIPSNSVLGLYRFGGLWSGVMIRAKDGADIVNVAAGSALGWGFEVEP